MLSSSDNSGWNGVSINTYRMPTFLEESPSPALEDRSFGFIYSGGYQGKFNINSNKWKLYDINHSSPVNYVPPDCQFGWRWWHNHELDKAVEGAILYMSPELINQVAVETLDKEILNIGTPDKIGFSDPLVPQIIFALKSETENPTPFNKLFAESATQILAIRFLNNHSVIEYKTPEHKSGLSKKHLQQVINYIHDHLDHDISLDSLSILAGLSSYHFARMFKQSTGLAPHQYVMQCRMDKAKEILQYTNHPISQIALEIGYESQSHFTHLFKRYNGVTPAAYRKSLY